MNEHDRPRALLLDKNALTVLLTDRSVDGATDLAEALISSDPWRVRPRRAAVVVSRDPLRLAILGYFDEADQARIDALRTQLDVACRGFRFVDYREAERLTEMLASQLRSRIDRDTLTTSHILAIPRGGHVVLGMLAYTLPAAGHQFEPSSADLWIVVDDCAISGARFFEWLDAHPGPDVVFAHLFSHPQARAAIEEHPRVRWCVAAQDLADHAPERLGEHYAEWQAAWTGRDSGVWVGQTDRIAFAWNEPDTALWNPATESIERGWHLVGPRRCLKNRRPVPENEIQVNGRPNGAITPHGDVMWATVDDEVLVADVGTDIVFGLSGVGAVMWRAAMENPTEVAAIDQICETFETERSRVEADWAEFIAGLVDRGLLVRG